jgi:hypothetical protein
MGRYTQNVKPKRGWEDSGLGQPPGRAFVSQSRDYYLADSGADDPLAAITFHQILGGALPTAHFVRVAGSLRSLLQSAFGALQRSLCSRCRLQLPHDAAHSVRVGGQSLCSLSQVYGLQHLQPLQREHSDHLQPVAQRPCNLRSQRDPTNHHTATTPGL